MKNGMLVFYRSPNGVDGWEAMKAVDVPAWLTEDPEVLGRMVDGEACHDDGEPDSPWYAAKRLLTPADEAAIAAAQAKRERKSRMLVDTSGRTMH